jgi:hypothetical protein
MPFAPKAEHIRELLDRLRRVRDIGLPVGAVAKVHEERLRQFVREGMPLMPINSVATPHAGAARSSSRPFSIWRGA